MNLAPYFIKRKMSLMTLFFIVCTTSLSVSASTPNIKNKSKEKIEIELSNHILQITPLTENSVRIRYIKGLKTELPDYMYVSREVASPKYQIKDTPHEIYISFEKMGLIVDKISEKITYLNNQKVAVLTELDRDMIPSQLQNRDVFISRVCFDSPKNEFLFGSGQFQDGYLNIRGLSRRLTQVNTQIAIPFILSSRGYGVLWNNLGLTELNPSEQKVTLLKQSEDGMKETVDVTSISGTKQETRESSVFKSELTINEEGDYSLLLDVGQKMARRHTLLIDGEKIIDVKNIWLPPTTSVITHLKIGKHAIEANLESNDHPVVYFKRVDDHTVLRSPVSTCIDYTVFVGKPDEVIASYRTVTGPAPMMPIWALGYIHCRERFHNQQEIINVANRFRKEKYPLDLIVQDWQYWGKYGWNAMKFDEDNYPDPKMLTSYLHQNQIRMMLSVWSRINPESTVGKSMSSKGYYIDNTQWIDFFNTHAAEEYWDNFSKNLLQPYHIDAWWQDATEPENDALVGHEVMNKTIPGEMVRNVYPLLVNKTVYEGCRKDDPTRRGMILTRSGYAGMQRYGAAMWSGDIGNDWETLRRQITGGLNLMASGMPWWTYDAGGFFRPKDQYTDSAYHERFLRWLQIATFLPLMRVHGYKSDTEFWNYGDSVVDISRKSLALRYRFLPYIYSQNAKISFHGGTLMRPLVMDYSDDPEAMSQKYEYMFGPSVLVVPIVEANHKDWRVYLPENKAGWYDYYTNKKMSKTNGYITVPISIESIPLYIKGGSILPFVSNCQHTGEISESPFEISIYPGCDAQFELYEDEGVNYNYEKNRYSIISFSWDEGKQQLTIHNRKGSFDGMNPSRKFNILLVNPNGDEPQVKHIVYAGKKTQIRF